MGRVVIELTNRCNLRCSHCFSGRHGGKDDLPAGHVRNVLDEARDLGFDDICYTGGDPTVYPGFLDVLRSTADAGYSFGFNTNGWNFAALYPELKQVLRSSTCITFSMDGAVEETHDALRGRGSYRRVVQAMGLCLVEGLAFSINMVVTAHNRHELGTMIECATRMGARGVRFGHLMPSPRTSTRGFDLAPDERKRVEARIHELAREAAIPVEMGPGYHTTDLFPCAPLHGQEINVDCHGNVTKCCHLSGHGAGAGRDDVYGNLADHGFGDLARRMAEENAAMRAAKLRRLEAGELGDSDYFACWHCSLHYRKVDWLLQIDDNPWAGRVRDPHRDPVDETVTG